MINHQFRIVPIILVMAVVTTAISCSNPSKKQAVDKVEKQLYLPDTIYLVSPDNDFNNPDSSYCYQRMVQSDNIALFWHKEYGTDPMANADEKRRFDPQFALRECERFYTFYVDSMKMVQKGHSYSDQYKLLIFVFGGNEGTAFGGGASDSVGILWTPAVRIHQPPYGALAHEMAHCFQYLSAADNHGIGPEGAIMEMSAQYLLWQVYPDWMTFENYHLTAFMKGTHYAFLHPQNMYHSPYVLEYWGDRHGCEYFGDLCRATLKGEDPVATYKRVYHLSQDQFNDELFDASRRFITWDLKRVQKQAARYANQHLCKVVDAGNGWYRIDSANCPQNYGYNGIRLQVPAAGTIVKLDFKGIAGDKHYQAVKTDKAGWRYGFVASLTDSSRVYGEIGRDQQGSLSFTVPNHTAFLWLVVSGAPTEHWPVVMRWGPPSPNDEPDAEWPYQFKLTGASVDDSVWK